MKRNMQVLVLAALLYGAQASAESAIPGNADLEPLASEYTYADMHAADIASQPFSKVLAGNADLEPLASESTFADRHAADIASQPFSKVLAGNADLEPLNQWTYAEQKATEREMQARAEFDSAGSR